ncbi:MAG: hypothetical protein KKH72_11460 [Alphaproteobacteria bacterium]|nr:hypothetical protein [Alphaproteobacteria bacterium]
MSLATLRAPFSIGAFALLLTCSAVPASLAEDLSEADRALSNVVVAGETGNGAPTAWLGETPHFVMVGKLGDFEFNIQLTDMAKSTDAKLVAKREYVPVGDKLTYADFEIALDLITNGIERSFELEFENADFSEHLPPAEFALQGENFPAGLLSNFEIESEWEWAEKNLIVNDERLASAGTLATALETGELNADHIADNGLIGGFVSAKFGEDALVVSFTAPVAEAEIDD